MEALRNLNYIKKNWAAYNKWEKEQNEDEARLKVLRNKKQFTTKEIENAANYGKTIVNAINIMDQISINKSENALISIRTAFSTIATMTGAIGAFCGYLFSKLNNNPNKTPKISAFIGYSLASLTSAVGIQFLNAHYEKMATRIARYQTRKNELSDTKNFIVYNNQQIKQAEEIAKNITVVKDITQDSSLKESLNPIEAFKKSISAVRELKKDYKQYQNWYKKYKNEEIEKKKTFDKINLTENQLENAQKDKDKILNVIKHLEIASNNYELNTHLGVRTVAAGLSLLSLGGGLLLGWLFSRLSKNFANNPTISLMQNYVSKLSIPAGIVSLFLLAGPLVQLTKESAQIGRHKEIEKLSQKPQNFIPFTDKEKNEVQNINIEQNTPKSIIGSIVDSFKDLIKVKKDINNYQHYKKNQRKQDLKIQKALQQINVSQEQLNEAKKLQTQVFNAFEKIDEKSESFVDDTSAAVETISNIINGTICTLANILTLKLFGNKISKFTQNKTIPGFFEGLKLTRHLSLKDLSLIFIAPFLTTRILITLVAAIGTEIQKKACKIGIMSAMKELDNPKNFWQHDNTSNANNKSPFSSFLTIELI